MHTGSDVTARRAITGDWLSDRVDVSLLFPVRRRSTGELNGDSSGDCDPLPLACVDVAVVMMSAAALLKAEPFCSEDSTLPFRTGSIP